MHEHLKDLGRTAMPATDNDHCQTVDKTERNFSQQNTSVSVQGRRVTKLAFSRQQIVVIILQI